MIILLALLCRFSSRNRLAIGLLLTAFGLFAIISALAHGVIAVIIGAIFLISVCRGRRREQLSYTSR